MSGWVGDRGVRAGLGEARFAGAAAPRRSGLRPRDRAAQAFAAAFASATAAMTVSATFFGTGS